jgi:hypothetical protein
MFQKELVEWALIGVKSYTTNAMIYDAMIEGEEDPKKKEELRLKLEELKKNLPLYQQQFEAYKIEIEKKQKKYVK